MLDPGHHAQLVEQRLIGSGVGGFGDECDASPVPFSHRDSRVTGKCGHGAIRRRNILHKRKNQSADRQDKGSTYTVQNLRISPNKRNQFDKMIRISDIGCNDQETP